MVAIRKQEPIAGTSGTDLTMVTSHSLPHLLPRRLYLLSVNGRL